VHCVVWAKELHKVLFGEAKASYLYEAEAGGEAEVAGAGVEAGAAPAARAESVYMHVVEGAPKVQVDAADPAALAALDAWCRSLFDAVFGAEISKRLSMAPDTFKTAAVPPQPLYLAEVEAGAHEGDAAAGAGGSSSGAGAGSQLADQRVLSLAESAALLLASLRRFYTDADTCASLGSAAFSKDSGLDLDFVTAAANLRAATFGIPRQSRFAVKSIAGNIIPAIATTNAMVAGLEVLEAIKALRGDDMGATGRATHICTAPAATNKLLLATGMGRPKADCFACGTRGVTLFIDTHRTSLRAFIDAVLKERLGFAVPNVDNGEAFNFVEERDADEEEEEYAQKLSFLPLPMAELVGGGLRSGVIATVTDFLQDKSTTVAIVHRDRGDFDELKHPQFFELVGEAEAASTQAALEAETAVVKQKQREAAAGQEAGAAAGSGAGGTGPAVGSKRSRAQAGAVSVSASGAAAQPLGASGDAGGVDLLGSSDEDGAAGHGSAGTGPAKRARIDAAAAAGAGASAGGTGGGGGDASAAAAGEEDIVVLDD
jgi:ubiquitin-like 1-activating enzyme E1 B